MVKAYKAPTPFFPESDTKIQKIPFITGLIQNGIRIVKSAATGVGTQADIYQVPRGKTFFLISCGMSVFSGGGGATTKIQVKGDVNWFLRMDFNFVTTLTRHEVTNASFSIPLKIVSGETIDVVTSSNVFQTAGWITGYEIDTSLIPNFV